MPNIEIIPPYPTLSTYDFYDDVVHHISLVGKGTPVVNRRIVNIVNLDGGVDDGYRIEKRNMQLKFALYQDNKSALVSKIDQLYEIFRPNNSLYPIRLKYTREDSSVREILCHVNGSFEIEDEEYFGSTLKTVVVPLVCPNPIWYDPTQVNTEFPIGTSGVQLSFTTYLGNWNEYPVIRIDGQITNPTIMLHFFKYYASGALYSGSYSFTITGTIANGAYYIVDLRPGYKTIYDNSGTSQISKLSSSIEDFAKFRIEPEPELDSIQVNYTSKNANAKVTFSFYNRYIGI